MNGNKDLSCVMCGKEIDSPVMVQMMWLEPDESTAIRVGTSLHQVCTSCAENIKNFIERRNDNEEQDFLIESESHNKTYFDGGVRPKDGGWVKIQNGVPVIVAASYENAIQGDVFNADVAEGGATANDEVTTSEITIIAGEGNVTIANAAGKKVVVSNILGQIVATQVLTSDNAVIAAPQGVVVVAVEGEEAVKAIVK